jgi:hypothetical protein
MSVLIVASLCAIAVVVVVVAHRAFAIIVNFVPSNAKPSSSLLSYPVAPSPVTPLCHRPSHRRRHRRLHRPLHPRHRRRHRLCSLQSSSSSLPVAPSPIPPSPLSLSSSPVAIVVVVVSCHQCLRNNTGTPHFSLGISISVWGSPNKNGDPQSEMGMRIE